MLPTTIRTAPSLDDYTSLADFQSRTPESFVEGKPVLHFHLPKAAAQIPKSQASNLAIFSSVSLNSASQVNGDAEQTLEQAVDVYVTSESVLLFNQQLGAGVSIPYPSISIHATKQLGSDGDESRKSALWMCLEFSEAGEDDDAPNSTDLTIVPSDTEDTSGIASQLYEAIATCSNLHPDPTAGDEDEDDEYDRIVFEGNVEPEAVEGFSGVLRGTSDGALPPPMPGSGGWITADNVHEYFDEDGNWLGDGPEDANGEEALGDGAGRTRGRDELDADGTNGHDANDDSESKRPRVDED